MDGEARITELPKNQPRPPTYCFAAPVWEHRGRQLLEVLCPDWLCGSCSALFYLPHYHALATEPELLIKLGVASLERMVMFRNHASQDLGASSLNNYACGPAAQNNRELF